MSVDVSATPARVALGLLALLLVGPFVGLGVRAHLMLHELQTSGIKVIGHISATQCWNHGQMSYVFAVDEKTYTGDGTCISACRSVERGAPVRIFYARENPGNSMCTAVAERLNIIKGNYFMLLLISLALAVVIHRVTSFTKSS